MKTKPSPESKRSPSPSPSPSTEPVPPEAVEAVLRAIDSLEWQVGRVKLARLLKGVVSADLVERGYVDLPYHGALASFSLAEIDGFIRRLVDDRYVVAAKGNRPLLRITLKGASALSA